MELPVYNEAGEVAGKIEFDPAVLGDKVKRRLRQEALEAEGHRPGPRGSQAQPALAEGRNHLGPQAARLFL